MVWFAVIVIVGTLAFLLMQGESASLAGLDGDGIAAMVSLLLIGTLVMSSYLAARGQFGNMVKQLAIWALIILALMAGYEYRYEMQNAASRITAGAIPGSPIGRTNREGAVSVELRRNGNNFTTQAQINDATARFIVDTGASTVVLTNQTASKAGLNVEELDFSIPVSTANGRAMAARARIDTLAIGPIERRDVIVLVAMPGVLFENLLGMNFLDTLSGYDVRQDRLILRN